MANKVLIAYASKYGATQEIAEIIGDALKKEGVAYDLVPLKNVKKLDDYRAAVIGTAIYIGQWYKPTNKFVQKNQEKLAGMPVYIFSTGPSGKGDPEELLKGWKYPVGLSGTLDTVKPKEMIIFGGHLNEKKMSGMEKWVVKRVGGDFGDYRDWEMINKWAIKVAKALKA